MGALYRLAVSMRSIQPLGVALLAIATLIAGLLVWRTWSERDLQTFSPPPGRVYDGAARLGLPAAQVDQPLIFQRLDAEAAFRFNASVPVSSDPVIPARPFFLPIMDVPNHDRALDCLTAAVYYEAASEGLEGQQAVAQVVVNRLRHPAFPHSVCGVVFSGSSRPTGCQFTFTCDGSLARAPNARGWARARAVAQAALNGFVARPVGQATHYHTLWVAPYWSPSLVKLANIGRHTFYRWAGANGLRPAFTSAHVGAEPLTALAEARPDGMDGDLPPGLAPPTFQPADLSAGFDAMVDRIAMEQVALRAAPPALPAAPEASDPGPAALDAPGVVVAAVEPPPLVPEQRRARRIARSTNW